MPLAYPVSILAHHPYPTYHHKAEFNNCPSNKGFSIARYDCFDHSTSVGGYVSILLASSCHNQCLYPLKPENLMRDIWFDAMVNQSCCFISQTSSPYQISSHVRAIKTVASAPSKPASLENTPIYTLISYRVPNAHCKSCKYQVYRLEEARAFAWRSGNWRQLFAWKVYFYVVVGCCCCCPYVHCLLQLFDVESGSLLWTMHRRVR